MAKCRCRKVSGNRGRRPVKPLFDGPIPDNAEYRKMVNGILENKRRRDVIADILEQKELMKAVRAAG